MTTWNIVHAGEGVGGPNTFCTEDTRANYQRLLNVSISRNILEPQNEDADIHLVSNGGYDTIQLEIDFIRKMKAKDKKVIVGMSADGRWLNGLGLLSAEGHHYTEVLIEADAIISEVNPNWKVYGRYQHKVIPISEPLEHFIFKSAKIKDIDVLLAGTTHHLAYAVEAAYMLLDKNPEYKCIIGTSPQYIEAFRKRHPRLNFEFTGPHSTFEEYLKRSKILLNLEMKPRGGRVPMWGYYAGIPVVCSSGAFYSQLYPSLAFDRIDLEYIVDRAECALQNSTELINNAKEIARPYYFPEWIKTIYRKLGI
jgi:hypothetical protein